MNNYFKMAAYFCESEESVNIKEIGKIITSEIPGTIVKSDGEYIFAYGKPLMTTVAFKKSDDGIEAVVVDTEKSGFRVDQDGPDYDKIVAKEGTKQVLTSTDECLKYLNKIASVNSNMSKAKDRAKAQGYDNWEQQFSEAKQILKKHGYSLIKE